MVDVVVEYKDNYQTSYGLLAHELTHCEQYLRGDISFDEYGNAGVLYDLNDEVEAYTVQNYIERGIGGYNETKESILKKYPGIYDKIPKENRSVRVLKNAIQNYNYKFNLPNNEKIYTPSIHYD